MITRNNWSAMAAFLMLLMGSPFPVNCFTAAPSKVLTVHAPLISSIQAPSARPLHSVGGSFAGATSTTTSLRMNFSPPDDNDTGGLGRGKILLVLAMIVNVWLFSIPPEFRRSRFCTDEDVSLHPEKHCTTFGAWRTGITEYYAKGGGIKFDFSIEGKEV
ncbi:hypothetical protein ACHAXA_000590 [Cyclostephanos tholiformis]|uniref:Uncharacterized protein n=1 Tax=Cyclostephanos tholiformis TaxID=382380 RepID=A0ABD3SQ83_9STRA